MIQSHPRYAPCQTVYTRSVFCSSRAGHGVDICRFLRGRPPLDSGGYQRNILSKYPSPCRQRSFPHCRASFPASAGSLREGTNQRSRHRLPGCSRGSPSYNEPGGYYLSVLVLVLVAAPVTAWISAASCAAVHRLTAAATSARSALTQILA
jgi:hypothetical protein